MYIVFLYQVMRIIKSFAEPDHKYSQRNLMFLFFRWGPVPGHTRGAGDQQGGGGGRRALHLPRHRPRHRGDGGARHRASGDVSTEA